MIHSLLGYDYSTIVGADIQLYIDWANDAKKLQSEKMKQIKKMESQNKRKK